MVHRAGTFFAGVAPATAAGERTTGRQAWGLLWAASRSLSILVLCWLVAGAVLPALVVAALGVVVGEVPAAVTDGFGSPAGHRLVLALVIAAVSYALSLVNDPVGKRVGHRGPIPDHQ